MPAPFSRSHRAPSIRAAWLLIPAALIVSPTALRAQTTVTAPDAAAVTPFTREVLKDFADWDTDHDGVLSPKEIDSRIADPHITTSAAAALGALKMALRGGKFEIPPLTRDYFLKYSGYARLHPQRRPAAPSVAAASTTTEADIAAPAAKKSTDYPRFDISYRSGLQRIQHASEEVFAAGSPRLEDVRQGQIGDCYFLAVIGGMLNRDPAGIRNMIAVQPDGSCNVTFPVGKREHVPALTDAEMAIGSSSHGTGRWLTILETAYALVRNDVRGPDQKKEIATDLIATGGSSRSVIRMLIGHQTGGILLRKRGVQAIPTAEESASNLAPARDAITAALKDKLLVTLGTTTADIPPGFTPRHAYALIGFDAATDTALVWNPHGNTFQPKGDSGLQNGYPTKNGIFSIPLSDLVRAFTSLSWERNLPDVAEFVKRVAFGCKDRDGASGLYWR